MDSLPIIFLHKGDSFYLKYALENARKFNPNSRIILIGDNVTVYSEFVEYYEMKKFDKYSKEFEKIYVHLNTSNPEIEMFCIKRWLVLLDFVQKQKLNKIFTCDSDVLLFEDITKDSKNYEKFDVSIVDGTNGCLNLINKIKVLDYYKKIVRDFYKKNKNYNKNLKITDMTFWKQLNDSKKFKVGELTKIINNSFYDYGYLSENYYHKNNSMNVEKIYFIEKLPFVKIFDKEVRVKSLHLQGPTKFYMKYFVNGKFNFLNKLKVDLMIFLRDNFSGKLSKNQLKKVKGLMIKLGF